MYNIRDFRYPGSSDSGFPAPCRRSNTHKVVPWQKLEFPKEARQKTTRQFCWCKCPEIVHIKDY